MPGAYEDRARPSAIAPNFRILSKFVCASGEVLLGRDADSNARRDHRVGRRLRTPIEIVYDTTERPEPINFGVCPIGRRKVYSYDRFNRQPRSHSPIRTEGEFGFLLAGGSDA